MAAYAAVVSLMDLLQQIKHHPNPPLSLDRQQAQSLVKKVSLLQRFLDEFHSRGLSQEIQTLESRIRDVAHLAEDVIESNLLFSPGSTSENVTGNETSTDIYEELQRVIQVMKSIEKVAALVTRNKRYMEFIEKKENSVLRADQRRSLLPPLDSSPIDKITTMIGFDDILEEIMDRLTGNQSRRDIIPLVGMGGAGKTTLARNIYERSLIVQHFDMRSWVTISQQWVVREVLVEILLDLSNNISREELSHEREENLGYQVYKSLCGRKYLIVLDDIWSIEAWDKLKFFFPDNNNGSRIMITTRLSKLASDLTKSHVVNLDSLDYDTSWDLLCEKVFVDKSCPLELEEIGKTIARNCEGLPLSIVTIGGVLAKASKTIEYWKFVAENSSSLVNSANDDRCLSILSLSYINLPVHLKPCFLYMGLFPEDEHIRTSYLIRLWVAEGFLKPISGKSLEVVGEGYLKDLVQRNLVIVHEWGSTGKIKFCGLHDLLRDLCLREAHKEQFFSIVRIDNLQGNEIFNTQRRVAIQCGTLNEVDPPDHGSIPLVLRSCIIGSEKKLISSRSVPLLRILGGVNHYVGCGVNEIVPLVNLRFISLIYDFEGRFKDIFSLWSMSWNLQTLLLSGVLKDTAPLDTWKMPQLRHVKISLIHLPDPPPPSSEDGGRLLVLENLQTLLEVRNFKCSEEVAMRIPNIKKLRILYRVCDEDMSSWINEYCLNNLGCLQNLESLAIQLSSTNNCFNRPDVITFPISLKKLSLHGLKLDNDTISTTIGGSLPLLEVLNLHIITFVEDEWNPVEGQFCHLKELDIYNTNLNCWNADNTHFPRLERLRISEDSSLEEFPWGIGDISTLQWILLYNVRDTVVISATRMMDDLEEQYGEVDFRIYVSPKEQKELAEGELG